MESYAFHLMPYKDSHDAAWPFPDDPWDPELGHQYYNEYLDELAMAEDLGFDGVGLNEHHFSTHSAQVAPNLTAANLAARTDEITIALLGNIIAVRRNPIRVAEEVAWLDNVTGGRILSGFPRGIPPEYLAYNVDYEQSRARFQEAWDLIIEAWTAEEPFDWDGEYYQFDDVYVRPRPYQQPHPPLWTPARSEETLRFAAERELPIGTAFHGPEFMAEVFANYRELTASEYGWTPTDTDFTMLRPIYVADSMAQARAEAAEHFHAFYKHFLLGVFRGVVPRMMGQEGYDPDQEELYLDNLPPDGDLANEYAFEEYLDAGIIIAGEPEDVVAEIEDQYETVGGFGRLAGLFQFGTLPHELTTKNLELYADEVLPEVANLGEA